MSGVMIAAGIAATATIVIGLIKNSKAKRRERAAAAKKAMIERKMAAFERTRQAVINPYADVKDNSHMAKDLSDTISNPFDSLGVATSGAEIQMEQTDIALANVLDTLEGSGASAGGATALANAAKRSKKEVAASIEQQEADNEKLAAQGEQELERIRMSEKQRIQGIQINEAGRVQSAQAQGKAFEWNAQEGRDMATLDRMQAGIDQENANVASAGRDREDATAAIIGGVASAGSAAAGGPSGGW